MLPLPHPTPKGSARTPNRKKELDGVTRSSPPRRSSFLFVFVGILLLCFTRFVLFCCFIFVSTAACVLARRLPSSFFSLLLLWWFLLSFRHANCSGVRVCSRDFRFVFRFHRSFRITHDA